MDGYWKQAIHAYGHWPMMKRLESFVEYIYIDIFVHSFTSLTTVLVNCVDCDVLWDNLLLLIWFAIGHRPFYRQIWRIFIDRSITIRKRCSNIPNLPISTAQDTYTSVIPFYQSSSINLVSMDSSNTKLYIITLHCAESEHENKCIISTIPKNE